MNFHSLEFVVFFPCVALAYFATPARLRWGLLLVASYYFYMCWRAEYALLIALSTLIDYVAGLRIHATERAGVRRAWLASSLAGNLGLLFFFKYFNFVSDSVRALFSEFSIEMAPITLNVLLPVGISFYTFQSLSYTIDIYRRRLEPERHFGRFALYVSFFPQLVAGPIERARQLLPQLNATHRFDFERLASGLRLMLWGFFKKLAIADPLAGIVDPIYADIPHHTAPTLWLATLLFGFQIYCDFSAYTDIARGSARVLGISLMKNFRSPFAATSPADFWHRWHISLSTWFQDYVFNPLYLSLGRQRWIRRRSSRTKHWIAFGLTLLIGESLLGFWHGANFTFLCFGLWHGAALYGYYAMRTRWDALPKPQQVGMTFVIVTAGWTFFRAASVADAVAIFTSVGQLLNIDAWRSALPVGSVATLLVGAPLILVLGTVEWLHARGRLALDRLPTGSRWALDYALCLAILVCGEFGTTEFIYFKF